MVTQSYKNYINSEKWKMKSSAYWAAFGRQCRACGAQRNLHVHHMSYVNFGNEPLSDLMGLCQPCHREVHRIQRRLRSRDLRGITLAYVNAKRASRMPSNR